MSFNNYLKTMIGLRTDDRVKALKDHGLEDYEALSELEDDDVKILVSAARRSTPPIIISALIEKRVKLACYGAKLYVMIGRPVTGDSLKVNRLKQIELHKSISEDHRDPSEVVPKVTKTYTIDKALITLPNYLRSKIGVRGVALYYVVREATIPSALEPLTPDLPYSEKSGSLMDELIEFTSLDGVGWEEDNATVFGILQEMVRDVSMSSSLKTHQRSRYGRQAYLSLIKHNLD